jgi:asparagine synthetase B (glutamine-hydrolysing)
MSWIFGYFGNTQDFDIVPPENSLYEFKNSKLIINSGGYSGTLFFNIKPNGEGWAVSGVGLKRIENSYRCLNAESWNSIFNKDNVNLAQINGHFVAIKYSSNEVEIFTDVLGLREIYLVKLPSGIGFTTRVDWLKLFTEPQFDLKEFGSRWLMFNQVSLKSVFKNIFRIVNASATIRNDDLQIHEYEYKSDQKLSGVEEEFVQSLTKFIFIPDNKISLSLSGGIDSRLILSFFIKEKLTGWNAHTFGSPKHPDSIVSSMLAEKLSFSHVIIDDELPPIEQLILMLKEYSIYSMVTNPISSILNLRFYNKINDDLLIIDGGFGEIWRQQFANRLRIFGQKPVKNKDAKNIFRFLVHRKADVFRREVEKLMFDGSIEQVENLFSYLPPGTEVGTNSWIELFSIRARLPNYYGPEQARVDNHAVSFMPLAQKDMLNLLTIINERDKKNGRLFKKLIRNNSLSLSRFPLVKGDVVYPFQLSSLSTQFYSKIKTKFGASYRNKQRSKLLKTIKDYAFDLISSNDVRNYDLYDKQKLDRIAKSLQSENGNMLELEWWLAFELFRQGVTKG